MFFGKRDNLNGRSNMTKKEPSMIERAFDYLSAIPKLKNLLKILWIFSTVFFGIVIIIEGTSVLMKKIPLRPELIKNSILYVTMNPCFAGLFYLWGKREVISEMERKK